MMSVRHNEVESTMRMNHPVSIDDGIAFCSSFILRKRRVNGVGGYRINDVSFRKDILLSMRYRERVV